MKNIVRKGTHCLGTNICYKVSVGGESGFLFQGSDMFQSRKNSIITNEKKVTTESVRYIHFPRDFWKCETIPNPKNNENKKTVKIISIPVIEIPLLIIREQNSSVG